MLPRCASATEACRGRVVTEHRAEVRSGSPAGQRVRCSPRAAIASLACLCARSMLLRVLVRLEREVPVLVPSRVSQSQGTEKLKKNSPWLNLNPLRIPPGGLELLQVERAEEYSDLLRGYLSLGRVVSVEARRSAEESLESDRRLERANRRSQMLGRGCSANRTRAFACCLRHR